ncbi:nucleotidyltransferase domain-containing protein [Scatolibacter rhodanostii]|uniref:nucleotidyltransferase domain-containing protein n=1 Tax=Scatolibacter rhodanostii TaxID=2014781 RepID=UPI0013563D4B|nr:nucleotidyltransferase domain-containing protein [Scatolibacter rhodanostii]
MLNELIYVNEKFTKIMQEQQGVFGAWYFGSFARGMTDEFSDIDIVFLIKESDFDKIDENLNVLLSGACDEITLRWAEGFNSHAIKNYGYLIRYGGKLFQYDVFLLNQGQIDDFMCQIHYTELKKPDVIFDKNNNVQALIDKGIKGSSWRADIRYLITTYWFHVQMSAKYLLRKDYFKLEGVLRILMDTHMSLLLTVYDKTTWGGSANKLHFIPEEKQEHLMCYGCSKDFSIVRTNLLQVMKWFCDDVSSSKDIEIIQYNEQLNTKVLDDWEDKTKIL